MASTIKIPALVLLSAGICIAMASDGLASPMPDESSLLYRRFRGADEVGGSDRGKDRDRDQGSQERVRAGGGDKSTKGRGGGNSSKSNDQIGR